MIVSHQLFGLQASLRRLTLEGPCNLMGTLYLRNLIQIIILIYILKIFTSYIMLLQFADHHQIFRIGSCDRSMIPVHDLGGMVFDLVKCAFIVLQIYDIREYFMAFLNQSKQGRYIWT